MIQVVRYNYRLRPGKQAEAALEAEWHRCRWLWNEAVHLQRSGASPTLTKLDKMLTEARSTMGWLAEGSQTAQQATLRNYVQSLQQSFKVKGRGRPQVKSRKKSLPSLEFSTRGFSIQDGRLCLAKTHPIPVVWSRELPSEPTSVRVFRDSLGHWYASFVVRVDLDELPPVDRGIGIDWGVSTIATTTDPDFDLLSTGPAKRVAGELAAAQRQMSRRQRRGRPQTKRYKKAKLKAARLHKKAARQRKHNANVWTKNVVKAHDLIAVEDFKPTFLAKSTMARKAADNAVGITKQTLIKKAERAGRKVVMVKPAYTTMTCSECFARSKRLELSQRTFLCETCGHTEGRDRNAAKTILAVAERGHTSVEDVRQACSPPSELDLIAV